MFYIKYTYQRQIHIFYRGKKILTLQAQRLKKPGRGGINSWSLPYLILSNVCLKYSKYVVEILLIELSLKLKILKI